MDNPNERDGELDCIRHLLDAPAGSEAQRDLFAHLVGLCSTKIRGACFRPSLSEGEIAAATQAVIARLERNNYNNLRAFLAWRAREGAVIAGTGGPTRTFDEWLRRLFQDEIRRYPSAPAGAAGRPGEAPPEGRPPAPPAAGRPPSTPPGPPAESLDERLRVALTVFRANQAKSDRDGDPGVERRVYEEVARALGLLGAESARVMVHLAHRRLWRWKRSRPLLGGAC
jgi:hypothetical protein